jgi:hypothetical protein
MLKRKWIEFKPSSIPRRRTKASPSSISDSIASDARNQIVSSSLPSIGSITTYGSNTTPLNSLPTPLPTSLSTAKIDQTSFFFQNSTSSSTSTSESTYDLSPVYNLITPNQMDYWSSSISKAGPNSLVILNNDSFEIEANNAYGTNERIEVDRSSEYLTLGFRGNNYGNRGSSINCDQYNSQDNNFFSDYIPMPTATSSPALHRHPTLANNYLNYSESNYSADYASPAISATSQESISDDDFNLFFFQQLIDFPPMTSPDLYPTITVPPFQLQPPTQLRPRPQSHQITSTTAVAENSNRTASSRPWTSGDCPIRSLQEDSISKGVRTGGEGLTFVNSCSADRSTLLARGRKIRSRAVEYTEAMESRHTLEERRKGDDIRV